MRGVQTGEKVRDADKVCTSQRLRAYDGDLNSSAPQNNKHQSKSFLLLIQAFRITKAKDDERHL